MIENVRRNREKWTSFGGDVRNGGMGKNRKVSGAM